MQQVTCALTREGLVSLRSVLIFVPHKLQDMKNLLYTLLAAGVVVIAGCGEDTVVCDGDKAIIRVVNNTVCTPDIEIEGDLMEADMPILDSAEYEVDAGSYTVRAKMALISACEDRSETFETECGGFYRFEVYVD